MVVAIVKIWNALLKQIDERKKEIKTKSKTTRLYTDNEAIRRTMVIGNYYYYDKGSHYLSGIKSQMLSELCS